MASKSADPIVVVEVPAGQRLLSEPAEPGVHLAGEFAIDSRRHYDATNRNVA